MSSPHPDGLGAQMAMQAALRSSSLRAGDIQYINLHGTATPANDSAEGLAVVALFGARVPCSSTKGATGHTLGAAGAVEAVLCAIALLDGFVPGSPGTRAVDPALPPLDYRLHSAPAPQLCHALTNSFGFGGSNCSLVFGGIGLIAPGLPDWPSARAVLRGEQAWVSVPSVLPAPGLLPPAERRRASRVIKLTLGIGLEAAAGADVAGLATVFSSSGADGHNCHALCEQLATADRHVSPTRFHNSVHNAPAGYWGIATKSMAPCQVLCAFDGSFGAGLIDALGQVVLDQQPTLLMAYDSEYPEPLHSARPLPDCAGLALRLEPTRTPQALARIT
eukprot:gene19946-39510_t